MPVYAVRVQACYHCERVPLNPKERAVCRCGTKDPLRANPDIPGSEPVYQYWGWRIPGMREMRDRMRDAEMLLEEKERLAKGLGVR